MWWLPLLLSAGSFAANQQAQKKVDRARATAMRDARQLRERKEKETAASAQSTADLLIKAASDEKARAAELEAQYAGPEGPADPGVQMPQKALDILAPKTPATLEMEDEFRRQSADELNRHIRARAALQSYGDVMAGNMITASRNASDIDRANTATRNWMNNVLPAQLEAANKKGGGWGTLADVLQLASAVTSMGSLSAPSTAASAAPAATAQSTAAAGAADTLGMDLFTRRELINFANNMKMPTVY